MERAVRTPADGRRFGLDLLHGRPDVVEELNLRRRLQTAYRLADGPADDVRFRQWRVVTPRRAERALQPVGRAEHATFAFDVAQYHLARVGHVFTEYPDPLVRLHHLV